MANAQVKFYKIQASQLASLPKKEGQIIFTSDNGKLYIDATNSSRIAIDKTYGLSVNGNSISLVEDGGSSTITLPNLDTTGLGASLALSGTTVQLKNANGTVISSIELPTSSSGATYWTIDGTIVIDSSEMDWLNV